MRKLILLLALLASCRSARVVESTSVVHDTIAVERVVEVHDTVRDSTATSQASHTTVEQTQLDTAGRVRTVTRIVTRTITLGNHTATATMTRRDTTATRAGTRTSSHNTTSAPARSPSPTIVLLTLAVIFMAIILIRILL